MAMHISRTCGKRVGRPRDICQAVLTARFPIDVLQKLFECLPQPLPDNNVINKDVDPKRLGSENNAMKEAQQAHT